MSPSFLYRWASPPLTHASVLYQEPVHERECVPVKRRLCARGVQTYNDVCDVSYETICTTIIATKYVEVSIVSSRDTREGQDIITPLHIGRR